MRTTHSLSIVELLMSNPTMFAFAFARLSLWHLLF
jgi:hypothetical protein